MERTDCSGELGGNLGANILGADGNEKAGGSSGSGINRRCAGRSAGGNCCWHRFCSNKNQVEEQTDDDGQRGCPLLEAHIDGPRCRYDRDRSRGRDHDHQGRAGKWGRDRRFRIIQGMAEAPRPAGLGKGLGKMKAPAREGIPAGAAVGDTRGVVGGTAGSL